MDNFLELLQVITKENGIILILIMLLFLDKFKIWIDLVEDGYKRWRKLDRKQANKNLEDYTLKVSKMHEILETFRESLGAGRVGYYVFHNGGKDIRGIPFLKYSCVNEAMAHGIRPRLKMDRDLQIAIINCWTKVLIAGLPEIGETSTLIQGGAKDILEEYCVYYYAIMPIYEDSMLSGFVLAEWRNPSYVPEDKTNIQEDIIQCAKMIELNSIKDINHFLSY